MTEKILCVDDDPNILQAYRRSLRKRFSIDTALGGQEALEMLAAQGPYAVIVADMQMPGMTGVELLRAVNKRSADTVRMMLTGNADQQTALEAVNEGHIFRFMTKPCPPETFAMVLEAGLAQYRLIRTERDLLSKTLSASVKMLTELLSLVSPTAFGKASRVRPLVRQLCQELNVHQWQIELAAMLSQIGCVSIPEPILAKAYDGAELTATECKIFQDYPLAGQQLIANIPRLEDVAEIIAYQQQHFDGHGTPGDGRHGDKIPLGSRILKVALDFDTLISSGYKKETAVAVINDRESQYDPAIVATLSNVLAITDAQVIRCVPVAKLFPGLTLADDIKTVSGTLVCARRQEITRSMLVRLRNYMTNVGVQASVRVFVPLEIANQDTVSIGDQR